MQFTYSANGIKLSQITNYGYPRYDYIGPFIYKNNNLEYIITSEGRAIFNNNTLSYYEYHLKDHLGNVRVAYQKTSTGEIKKLQQNSYYPFGLLMGNRIQSDVPSKNRYLYNGKELISEYDIELNWYDYGARMYDTQLGRWWVMDPLVEKEHYNYTPYAYVYNNPLLFIDPFGLDSAQRAQAVERAREYVDKKLPGNQYKMGAKGGPGEKVDCSGLVSNCVKAGDEPDPNRGNKESGVLNIESNTIEINSKYVVPGNLVTFRNTKKGSYPYHIGIVTNVERDKDGNLTKITYIHSSGGKGPNEAIFDINSKGNIKIHGFYKWDTKPDISTNISKVTTISQAPYSVRLQMSRVPIVKTLGDILSFFGY